MQPSWPSFFNIIKSGHTIECCHPVHMVLTWSLTGLNKVNGKCSKCLRASASGNRHCACAGIGPLCMCTSQHMSTVWSVANYSLSSFFLRSCLLCACMCFFIISLGSPSSLRGRDRGGKYPKFCMSLSEEVQRSGVDVLTGCELLCAGPLTLLHESEV